MKKFLLFLLPVALAPSITACQDTAHSIVTIKMYDEEKERIELSKEQFKLLLNSGQQFVIDFYSPYCSHCLELNPLLDDYVRKTGKTIYSLDLTLYTSDELTEMQINYPSIFPDLLVPAIRYISNKILTFEVSSNKFSSYTALKSIMDKHFISSNIYYAKTVDAYDDFKSKRDNYILFAYDLNYDKSLQLAADNLITKSVANSKQNVMLVNPLDLQRIKAELNIDYDHFIASFDNYELIKIADYSSSDFDISEFIY